MRYRPGARWSPAALDDSSIEDMLTLDLRQAEAERDGAVRAGDELRRQRDRLELGCKVHFWVGLVVGAFVGGVAASVVGVFA